MSEQPDDPCVCGHERQDHESNNILGCGDTYTSGADCPCSFFTLDPEMVKVQACIVVGSNREWSIGGESAQPCQGEDGCMEWVVETWGAAKTQRHVRTFWVKVPIEGKAGEG